MDNHYVDERVSELGSQIRKLERTVADLNTVVSTLTNTVNTKVNKEDVQRIIKQSEVIKKINDSKPIGMDSKVSISLGGKVIAESVVEHTTDAIKISANDINGVNK